MPVSVFKKGVKEQLDMQEVFNIWNMLRARYFSLEIIKFFINFAHDRDFAVIMTSLSGSYEKQVAKLEKLGEKFKVKVPERPPYKLKTSVKIDIISDKFIFRSVYNGLVAQLFSLMTAYRSSTTNDRIRKVIADDLIQHMQDFETLYKYGKLKGWQDDPPAYKTAKAVVNEPLSASEAFHIWDNLSHRYDQVQLTKYFLEFAHDKDFKIILALGLKQLAKEIRILEEKAVAYEVALPDRPAASLSIAMDPETMKDIFMFRVILKGIQDAFDLHSRAVIESIRNDSLRNLFMDFWKREIRTYERFLRYGKMKGWTKMPPMYTMPV